MARQGKSAANNMEAPAQEIECEPLEPIHKVVRELKRPDGTTLRVEVPVYPPFRLKDKSKANSSEKNSEKGSEKG